MSSKSEILAKIKVSKPENIVELNKLDFDIFNEEKDFIKEFKNMVDVVGGKADIISSNTDVLEKVQALFPDTKKKYTFLKDLIGFNTIDLEDIKNAQDFEDLDILVLEGEIGVAENGAIWLSDEQIPIRVLPFITKNLVLIIDKKKIVAHMHQAYKQLKNLDYNYGVFISGPSKTADIEQSLVIGAQGALSLTIYIK